MTNSENAVSHSRDIYCIAINVRSPKGGSTYSKLFKNFFFETVDTDEPHLTVFNFFEDMIFTV